jgi:4-alpha-glucanotransferase
MCCAGNLPAPVSNNGSADFKAALKLKTPLIRKAAEAMLSGAQFSDLQKLMSSFRKANAWIEESALFDCLCKESAQDGKLWWTWDKPIRSRDKETLKKLRKKHSKDIDIFITTQFLFDLQWQAVKVCSRIRLTKHLMLSYAQWAILEA